MPFREAFHYPFSAVSPAAAHIDPPNVAVYETLLRKGPGEAPMPGLARSWTVSDDGLEWRFALAPNVTFHSGARCDARAVVDALEYLRWNLLPGREHWYWRAVDRISPDGSGTVVVRLHHPQQRLPSLLWGTHSAIHNEQRRAAAEDRFGYDVADGTGPYRLTSWSESKVGAERFSGYWQTGSTEAVECIEWVTIISGEDRVQALRDGDIQIASDLPRAACRRLVEDHRIAFELPPSQANVYLALDWRRQELLFDDVRVRQAISLAIDRQAIVDQAYGGDAQRTAGPLPPGDHFYDSLADECATFDPRQATALLAACGWQRAQDGVLERGRERFILTCVCQDEKALRAVGDSIRGNLRAIGIEAQIHVRVRLLRVLPRDRRRPRSISFAVDLAGLNGRDHRILIEPLHRWSELSTRPRR